MRKIVTRDIIIQDEKDNPLIGFQVHKTFLKLSPCGPSSNICSQVF